MSRKEKRKYVTENVTPKLRKYIREQVSICEDLARPLTREQLETVCNMETEVQVENYLHGIKFA